MRAARRGVQGAGLVQSDAVVAYKVFDYPPGFCWLVYRAFWQDCSKRAMETLVPESGGEEGGFEELVAELVSGRVKGLVRFHWSRCCS